jgi:putative endonuclease
MAIWLYVLRLHSGEPYVGIMGDLLSRLLHHKTGVGAQTTTRYPPGALAHVERFLTYAQASRRERQIKGWTRMKKEALISQDFDCLRRLARCRSPRPEGDPPPRARPP